MIDLRTPKEKQRDERNRRIRHDFGQLRKDMPEAADYRLFVLLGCRYNMSWNSIRNIVKQ